MMVNILLAFHEIVDDALGTTVGGFITAGIFEEWLIRHIQQQRTAILHDVMYHLLNR